MQPLLLLQHQVKGVAELTLDARDTKRESFAELTLDAGDTKQRVAERAAELTLDADVVAELTLDASDSVG